MEGGEKIKENEKNWVAVCKKRKGRQLHYVHLR